MQPSLGLLLFPIMIGGIIAIGLAVAIGARIFLAVVVGVMLILLFLAALIKVWELSADLRKSIRFHPRHWL